jgi:hypothetical protein
MKTTEMDALYVCYWSLRDPLCQSQALSVLEGLAAEGRVFGLITFEQEPWRASTEEDETLRLQLGRRGVRWLPLRYHKTPRGLSTLFDILQGALVAARGIPQWRARRPWPGQRGCRGGLSRQSTTTTAVLQRR